MFPPTAGTGPRSLQAARNDVEAARADLVRLFALAEHGDAGIERRRLAQDRYGAATAHVADPDAVWNAAVES